ncbi:alpha-amylase family glycosyl hydrolase [Demequina capsici]|uniref:Alpha-amylase family glycosyl hydrolase n=1 Tax=Demequina capsici TaxID=3075620 RepID=A0AA96JAR6_9MICO|nr:alpha-amylase family glycosyl hydrolase [Demequina sp. OYTSA14]WNM24991.1 alpha-amylase family glycosyl hydrolase [Demequina sp. OYTSA14]
MTTEPTWVADTVWWRVYPLGACGVLPEPPSGPVGPDEHRLLRLIPWLDHVVALGATGIALGPIFASTSHGYDTTDHLRIDPRLGTEEDFDTLAAAVHARGLRLELDGVFNHVGRAHPLAQAALAAGPESDESSWLRRDGDPGGRRFVPFEGHDSLLTLNHDDPRVRSLVIDTMRHWLDRGADAWRLDAAYAVPTSFWADVLPEVRRTHPDLWCEAEVIHGDYAAFVTDSTADTVTQYELWKALWSSINDRNLFELAWTLTRHDSMLATFAPVTFVGNHDVTRIASRIEDPRHLPHAIVALATLGGTPEIYAGDEFGLRALKEERAGGDDAIRPELPADPSTMTGDDGVLQLHRRLLRLRRDRPWLHRATTEQVSLTNEVGTFRTAAGRDAITVVLNLSDAPAALTPTGPLLDADDATLARPHEVAPHGWAVLGA